MRMGQDDCFGSGLETFEQLEWRIKVGLVDMSTERVDDRPMVRRHTQDDAFAHTWAEYEYVEQLWIELAQIADSQLGVARRSGPKWSNDLSLHSRGSRTRSIDTVLPLPS